MSLADLHVAPLSEGLFEAWRALFDRASSTCFCRFWHFDGTKNDWLARSMTADTNRDEARAAVRAGTPDALGLVAMRGDACVGWMKIAPLASLPKLPRTLKGLPVLGAPGAPHEPDAWCVGCVLVDPSERRRGVARALAAAAPAFARERGARALYAFPRRTHATESSELHDEAAWMGPESLFVKQMYVRSEGPAASYPVYRLSLFPPAK